VERRRRKTSLYLKRARGREPTSGALEIGGKL
jgi:hypothetical protein